MEARHFVASPWQIVLPLVRVQIAVQALWAFMGPFGDYILSKFLLRDEVNYTVAVGLQTFISDQKIKKIAFFAAGAILIPVQSVSYSSSYKELCFRLDSWWRSKDKIESYFKHILF